MSKNKGKIPTVKYKEKLRLTQSPAMYTTIRHRIQALMSLYGIVNVRGQNWDWLMEEVVFNDTITSSHFAFMANEFRRRDSSRAGESYAHHLSAFMQDCRDKLKVS